MASPPRSAEREEERRLNLRTLVIASAASASAAAVTSQLWIAGTWIAAAVTPVMVALVSEILNRPTEKIARAWTSERGPAGVQEPLRAGREPRPPPPVEPRPLPPVRPSNGSDPPVRIYRQPASHTTRRRGRIAIGVVAATAAIAFGVAVFTITAGELIAGGSIGKSSGRTTLGVGNKKKDKDEPTSTDGREQTTTEQTETSTTPPRDETTQEQTTEPTTPETTTTPAPSTQTPTETAPAP